MELSTRLKFLLFSLFISASAHGKDQYACFLYKTAPQIKLTIEGYRLTMQHPASGILPARTETVDMLNLNTPRDQVIASIDSCTLIQNSYVLGFMSKDYCWKESSQQLWIGSHDFRETADSNTGSSTTLYNCLKID
jgi:hypothetical protein